MLAHAVSVALYTSSSNFRRTCDVTYCYYTLYNVGCNMDKKGHDLLTAFAYAAIFRSDFLSLPFQAIECSLAGVKPKGKALILTMTVFLSLSLSHSLICSLSLTLSLPFPFSYTLLLLSLTYTLFPKHTHTHLYTLCHTLAGT